MCVPVKVSSVFNTNGDGMFRYGEIVVRQFVGNNTFGTYGKVKIAPFTPMHGDERIINVTGFTGNDGHGSEFPF